MIEDGFHVVRGSPLVIARVSRSNGTVRAYLFELAPNGPGVYAGDFEGMPVRGFFGYAGPVDSEKYRRFERKTEEIASKGKRV